MSQDRAWCSGGNFELLNTILLIDLDVASVSIFLYRTSGSIHLVIPQKFYSEGPSVGCMFKRESYGSCFEPAYAYHILFHFVEAVELLCLVLLGFILRRLNMNHLFWVLLRWRGFQDHYGIASYVY